jgi:hypothetical protein
MRGRFVTLCLPVFLLLISAKVEAPEPKPGSAGRYIHVNTFRVKTLEKELNQAAAAGYRVAEARILLTSERQSVLLRKTEPPGESYRYLVLQTTSVSLLSEKSPLEREANKHGPKGYRLLPRAIGYFETGLLLAIMELTPGPPASYQYLVLAADCQPAKWSRVEDALRRGYRPVGIATGVKGGRVILESGSAAAEPEAAVDPQHYRCLKSQNVDTLEKELQAAAQAGYRVSAFGSSLSLVLVKTATPEKPFQYLLLGSHPAVKQAGADGYRVLGYIAGDNLLLEKPPEAAGRYEYSVLENRSPEGLTAEVNRLAAEGYQLVGLSQDSRMGMGYAVMERPSQQHLAPQP